MQKMIFDGKHFNCESKDCPFRTECANHDTSGDFRTEDGFTPVLVKVEEEWFCSTRDSEVDMTGGYGIYPANHSGLRGSIYLAENGDLAVYDGPFEEMQ